MSKFNVGDRVRVVSITDIDAELDDPWRVVRTNEKLAELGFGDYGPKIDTIGVVTEIHCDYYDLSIRMEGDTSNDEFAMIDADLELIP